MTGTSRDRFTVPGPCTAGTQVGAREAASTSLHNTVQGYAMTNTHHVPQKAAGRILRAEKSYTNLRNRVLVFTQEINSPVLTGPDC